MWASIFTMNHIDNFEYKIFLGQKLARIYYICIELSLSQIAWYGIEYSKYLNIQSLIRNSNRISICKHSNLSSR